MAPSQMLERRLSHFVRWNGQYHAASVLLNGKHLRQLPPLLFWLRTFWVPPPLVALPLFLLGHFGLGRILAFLRSLLASVWLLASALAWLASPPGFTALFQERSALCYLSRFS